MDVKARIREVLERGHLTSLGTVDEGGAWVADVIYIFDTDFTLYWMSDPDVRHSKAILGENRVAATITVSNEGKVPNLGIQIAGVAEKIEGARFDLAKKHFAKRGKPEPKEEEDVLQGDSWYMLKPAKIDLIDEENLGFEKESINF